MQNLLCRCYVGISKQKWKTMHRVIFRTLCKSTITIQCEQLPLLKLVVFLIPVATCSIVLSISRDFREFSSPTKDSFMQNLLFRCYMDISEQKWWPCIKKSFVHSANSITMQCEHSFLLKLVTVCYVVLCLLQLSCKLLHFLLQETNKTIFYAKFFIQMLCEYLETEMHATMHEETSCYYINSITTQYKHAKQLTIAETGCIPNPLFAAYSFILGFYHNFSTSYCAFS